MGLIVDVYRDSGPDCTANGVSKHFNRLLVVNVDGPFEGHDMPRVVLKRGNLAGTVKLVPETADDAGDWVMFGGNFAGTSDSRFSRAVEEIAGSRQPNIVPIHDRIER
jgi:hypothetical protein